MRLFVVVLLVLFALKSNSQTALPAFVGAQGFGASATGGRVIAVTNPRSSGAGSLQNALDQTGARSPDRP
jgi:pectate lyase